MYDDTWIYDIASQYWTRPDLANDQNPHPSARYSAIFGIHEQPSGNAVIIGFGRGRSSNLVFNDVWSLDLSTMRWSLVLVSNTPPAARYGAVGGIDQYSDPNEIMFIVSHGTNGEQSFTDSFALFLYQNTSTWLPVKLTANNVPSPRTFSSSVLTSN